MDYLPVFLRVSDQPVLVVGGGEVALRKAEWFLKAGARVTVLAPTLHPDLAARVAANEVTHVAAAFAPAHLQGKLAAVAATDDRAGFSLRAVAEWQPASRPRAISAPEF